MTLVTVNAFCIAFLLCVVFFSLRNRRSIRLKAHDYNSSGIYFVTLCSKNRECLFGEIQKGKAWLNPAGLVVAHAWCDLPNHYPGLTLDAFVVMPNHVHGVLALHSTGHRKHGLPEIIRALKTFSARRINEARGTPGVSVWQRNYYDHLVRHDAALHRIRRYIAMNPLKWESDRENPTRR